LTKFVLLLPVCCYASLFFSCFVLFNKLITAYLCAFIFFSFSSFVLNARATILRFFLLLFCRITDPLLHRYWRKQGLGTVASKLLVSDGSALSVAVLFLEFTFLQ